MAIIERSSWRKLILPVCLLLFVGDLALAQDNSTNNQQIDRIFQDLGDKGIIISAAKDQGDFWPNIGHPPKFGVVARDEQGKLLDMFDLDDTGFKDMRAISIPGYNLPPGGTFERVGTAGWYRAIADFRASNFQQVGFGLPVEEATSEIDRVGAIIRESLCEHPGRPTEIVMTFDASFKLVVAAGAGTQLKWDMEIVCNR